MRQTCFQHQHPPSNLSNHPHYHHHAHQPCHVIPSSTLAPLSPSTSASGVASAVTGVSANGGVTCCTPGGHSHHTTVFNGTATLPASYSSAGNDHFTSCSYYRSRSIGPNSAHQCALFPATCIDQQNCCAQYSLPFSRRAIALFALSLVFILIWSSVVSFVLLTDSFKGQQTTKQTAELFELHRDVGQLAFEVGEEMCKFILFTIYFKLILPMSNFFIVF